MRGVGGSERGWAIEGVVLGEGGSKRMCKGILLVRLWSRGERRRG